jgi:hypothetical protein
MPGVWVAFFFVDSRVSGETGPHLRHNRAKRPFNLKSSEIMLRSHITHLGGVLVLTLSIAATTTWAEVNFAIVAKETFVSQEGPTAGEVFLDEWEPFAFNAQIGVQEQSDLTNPTVRRVGGTVHNLVYSDDDGYEFYQEFTTLAAMNSAYPSGDYVIAYTPSGGPAVSRTLALTGDFVPTPLLLDWFDLQHIPVNEDFTIEWSEFEGGTTDDMIVVEINDRQNDDVVFETGIHLFGEPDSLDGTARSLTIPAGTLTAGRAYEAYFLFFDMDTVDEQDGFFASFHQTEIQTDLGAVTQHPSTVIDAGVLGRWTAHRQTGPDTINPLSGEDSAWVFTTIVMDNNHDLNSVLLNHQHGLVRSADDEEGWSFLHTLPGEQELLSWMPNGKHSLSWDFSAGGSHQTTLNLAGSIPDPVRISNWDDLQNASADAITTIRWIDPGNVRDFDGYIVRVDEAGSDDTVFETDLDLETMAGLFGNVTSVDIPAGTLEPGKVYYATINFMRLTDIDSNSQAGAWFVAVNGVETEFTINTGATGGPDPVQIGGVGRDVYYLQSGPDAPVLHPNDPDQFTSFSILVGESLYELSSASVTLPGGAVRNMQFDSDDGEWISATHNASLSALLADFVDGDYALKYTVTGGAEKEITITLDSTFPGVPQVTNWTEAQSVLASEPFTITWSPIANMTEVDAIMVYIDPVTGSGVYYDFPPYFIDAEGLRGTAVSATIPAGTLETNSTYTVEINALHFTDLDVSRPGQIFGAFNLSNTLFQLKTTGVNQPPTVDSLLLDDGFEGQTYNFSVIGSDPEDGFNVSMRAPILPDWLTFIDAGNGLGTLAGTPSAANVGVFTVAIEVTDSQGLTATRKLPLTVYPDLSDPEGRALDIDSITWHRDLASAFEVQIAEVQYGESALISGAVGDGATSFLRGEFTGPLKLSFYWKVSSQAGSDFFRVEVDGTVEAEISGEQNWRQQILSLPAGTHSVVWSYVKDGSGSDGADRGWLDHVTLLPADTGAYAGTYLGGIDSSTGEVAMYIRPDNTAVLLGYHPESGKGLSNFSFEISATGTFSFEVVNPDDMNSNYTVSGSISGGTASGTVSGLGLTFTADLVSGGGQMAAYEGYYQTAMTTTTSGLVYLIVAGDGRTFLYAEDGDYVEGVITSIDAAGNISLVTDQGYEYDLTVDPTTDFVAGSVTPPGGEVSSILGIREGSPGDDVLANISTRGQVLTGNKVMIASFVITGNGSKQLLIRAIGPKLTDFGVTGALPDPTIDLVRLGEVVPMISNDNWEENEQPDRVASESVRLGAFDLDPGSLDSALLLSLEPGAYTAKVRGSDGTTGVGLVEVYDADDSSQTLPSAELVNIATRGEVGTGPNVLIAGFVVSGDVPKRVLIRGIGPQLAAYGVQGVLADPQISLVDSTQQVVASNNDWGDNTDVAAVVSATSEVGAFALDEDSKDAVLLIWLEPGRYTAKVSGADGGTGVALIEVYDN